MSTNLTTSQSLADDLDLIGHLDHKPPCDGFTGHDCPTPAAWAVTFLVHHCGCRVVKFRCTEHQNAWLQILQTLGFWKCDHCGAAIPGIRAGYELITIDRIEPLR